MESYKSGVSKLAQVNFLSCLELAKRRVPQYARSEPLYLELERGTKILQTEDQLNAYLAYYGEWHRNKIRTVLPHVPIFGEPFDLVDWGSGQGISLLALGDHLGDNSQNLRTVTLIEPSEIALERAEFHAACVFPEATICRVNKRFEDIVSADFTPRIPVPRIHLFSNVLDMNVFRNLEGSALKNFILTVREYAFALDEYFLCVSPCCNGVSARFERFLEIINDEERWRLEHLFHCCIQNTRPTLSADIVHYRSRLLNGDKHYTSVSTVCTLCDLAAAGDVVGLGQLVKQGYDVNEPDDCGCPPLLHAVRACELEAARFLVESGADVNAANPQGATALYFAAKTGDVRLVDYLLRCDADTERCILKTGTTPLMKAIERQDAAVVRLLLDSGCRIDSTNVRGVSPLKLAELCVTGDIDVIKGLLEQRVQS